MRSWLAPAGAAAGVAASLSSWLFWPLPISMWDRTPEAIYVGGHTWTFTRMAAMLTGDRSLSATIENAGYPDVWTAPFVGWGAGLLVAPLQAIDPVVAVNTAVLFAPVLSALAAFALLVRALRFDPWVAALCAQLYAFCPYALGTLASGQIEKTQLWILPLALLGT